MYKNEPSNLAADQVGRQDAMRAESWQHSPEMEEATRLKRDHPRAFAALPAVVKMSLGLYAEGKRAAEAAGRDVTGGDR
jgi:hypothetical protein